MVHRMWWFVAGVAVSALLIGALAFGAPLMSHLADAQGTWQVKTVSRPLRSPDEMKTPLSRPNAEQFISDWVATLPDSCDIVLTDDPDTVFYRCP